MFFNFPYVVTFLLVLTAIVAPRWVKYCSDLKGLNKCFLLVGAEQHSGLLKVNIYMIQGYHSEPNSRRYTLKRHHFRVVLV